ncbi:MULTISPECIES: universal stress protein [Sphingosinicellaceae]|uniref:universal stress protein n=1 Tax=Sphingosinicellaceae TaxID=2820280 RepID=UPI001C1E12A1|nr:universal stress protein [Polymorphobacter sp. PAMC 29334]UAJ10718.1 universal stress protein [Polymorphobacter megasporae]
MDNVRTFLVVVDDTPESRVAMRFAALRAAHVDGRVTLLHTMPVTEFMQWGGVQELIEAEAKANAEALLAGVADELFTLSGQRPGMIVRQGEPTAAVLETVAADPSIRALVLGAAPKGAPGPLVAFFSGERAGTLPCLVMIVPGSLNDARLAELA